MASILLGVTGSVAAIRTPELYALLRQRGFAVKVVATRSATYFFDPLAIEPLPSHPRSRNGEAMILDEDEWPAERYQRNDPVLHIELRRWADLLLVAPLDANTLAKFACGLSDNCLTCVWRAWDPAKPIVLAPAMNTVMWQHPLTARHLAQIASDHGIDVTGIPRDPEQIGAAINERSRRVRIAAPQIRRLACGDTGVGAMADLDIINQKVAELVTP